MSDFIPQNPRQFSENLEQKILIGELRADTVCPACWASVEMLGGQICQAVSMDADCKMCFGFHSNA